MYESWLHLLLIPSLKGSWHLKCFMSQSLPSMVRYAWLMVNLSRFLRLAGGIVAVHIHALRCWCWSGSLDCSSCFVLDNSLVKREELLPGAQCHLRLSLLVSDQEVYTVQWNVLSCHHCHRCRHIAVHTSRRHRHMCMIRAGFVNSREDSYAVQRIRWRLVRSLLQ